MQKPSYAPLLAIALAFWWATLSVQAEQELLPIASYKLDARLELDERQHPTQISGSEQLTWRNAAPDTINELQFHLYLNAFKNKQSTFFKESGGKLRGIKFQESEWGGIEIKSIKVGNGRIANGPDLAGKLKFIQPDDKNAEDQTVVSLPLDQPLKPHETITLNIEFTARLPRVFARTGYWDKFALVAQWFPKIGVWEKKGERQRAVAGWNCHQFHADTEFYADFGDYDATLTVPAIYQGKLGATGALQSERVNADGTVSYHYTQANVHDFAWTVDGGYVTLKRTFKPVEWIKPADLQQMSEQLKLPAAALDFNEVAVTLLLQPEHLAQTERHFRAAFNALKYLQLWYGRYPHATLTIVDPPLNAEGAGGMEYPTFITAGARWWASEDQTPETVIVHEIAHQYWQGLIASNEFEEAWLDEGFTTYTEIKLMQTAYGDNRLPARLGSFPIWSLPIALPHAYANRVGTFAEPFNDPLQTAAWKYYDSDSYGINSYARAGLMLHTLSAWLGEATMARVMFAYAARWRYRHPSAADFYAVVNEISGQDQTWFFQQFARSTATLDYEIVGFDNRRPETAEAHTVTVRRLGEAWYPHELRLTLKDETRITIKPLAVNQTRIEYRLTNEKTGAQWDETWPQQDRTHRFRVPGGSEIKLAQLDPDNRVLLEANQVNNSYVEAVAVASATRWAMGLMFWLQAILQMTASFT